MGLHQSCCPNANGVGEAFRQFDRVNRINPDDPRMWLHSKPLNPKETEELNFNAPEMAGMYLDVCTVPGHAAIMKGEDEHGGTREDDHGSEVQSGTTQALHSGGVMPWDSRSWRRKKRSPRSFSRWV